MNTDPAIQQQNQNTTTSNQFPGVYGNQPQNAGPYMSAGQSPNPQPGNISQQSQIPNQQQVPQVTLEDKLAELQTKWTKEITDLNNMMKTLPRLDELLNIIYTKRQEAVEYYHNMNSIILKQTKEYKQEFNTICTAIRTNGVNGIRMQNDTAIAKHAESVLLDKKIGVELLGNHNTYIKETIQTIDNMIYGINQKVKLAEILNGLKF